MKQARGPKKKEGGFLHAGLLKRNCYSDVHQESTREDQGRKTFPTLIWPRKSASSVCVHCTHRVCVCVVCVSLHRCPCVYIHVCLCAWYVCLLYMAGGAVNVCVLWGLRCSHTLWAMLGQAECCWTLQKRAFSPPEGPLFSVSAAAFLSQCFCTLSSACFLGRCPPLTHGGDWERGFLSTPLLLPNASLELLTEIAGLR